MAAGARNLERGAPECPRGGGRRLRAPAGAAEAIAGGGSAWHRPCDDNKHFGYIWPQREARFARFGGALVPQEAAAAAAAAAAAVASSGRRGSTLSPMTPIYPNFLKEY